jgi:hypothetical protein
MDDRNASRWLLLIHQIPPKPAYFRVKIWRRLQKLGAVAIKNSVYVLPRGDQAQEDFQWTLREITAGGGEASVCEAQFVDGLSDAQIQTMFQAARDADYGSIAEEARALAEGISPASRLAEERRAELGAQLVRLKRRWAEVAAIDFFGAPGREIAEGLLTSAEALLRRRPDDGSPGDSGSGPASGFLGRTWVTRSGIHVDRMASAWLIRRFIDPEARFKFVSAKGYQPEEGELRFDMFEAEYTHEGDLCTFEVLLERFALADPALRPLAEIVHDVDLKDSKFGRPETPGIARLVAGIAMAHKADEERLARGSAFLEDLYEYFRRRPQ